MASSQAEVRLKHLGFVRALTINAVGLMSNLYGYAKRNSGPLKSAVDSVENAVTTVVGPVYGRLNTLPNDLLVFLDNKVDEGAHKFNECAPPLAKKIASNTRSAFAKTSQVTQDLVQEAKAAGPLAAITRIGKISKHFALSQFAVVWYKVNQHPGLRGVTEIVVPKAALWSNNYNKVVKGLAERGYYVFNYVPLVPVREMARAYKQVEAAAAKKTDTTKKDTAKKTDTTKKDTTKKKDTTGSSSSDSDKE